MMIIDIFLTSPDNSFLKDIVVAIIAGVITFLGLIYTFTRENRKEKKHKKELHIEKLVYLATIVVQAETHIKSQIINFREFIAEIELNFISYPKLKLSPSLSVSRIALKIDQSEYYHAYLEIEKNEKQADSILLFFEYMDYFHAFFEDIHQEKQKLFQHHVNYKIKYEENLKTVIQELLNMFDNNSFTSHYSPKINEIYTKYNEVAFEYPRDVGFHQNFLDEVYSFISHPINEAKSLIRYIKEASHTYNAILMNGQMARDQFRAYANALEEGLNDFQTHTDGIKKYYALTVDEPLKSV